MSIRPVKRVIEAQPAVEGAGVYLRRAFGLGQTDEFDPFLLLDDFRNDNPDDYLAGFPWHPHRGIETITYVLKGVVSHGDSLGNSGTLGAGDYLKREQGSKIVAVEPIECPTMLYNGYGAHNIQGIGDKHIPLIQNVMNSDVVAGISDTSCDALDVLFNTEVGRDYLARRRGVDPGLVDELEKMGLSGIANVLAAIKTARYFDLAENNVIVTVATDGAGLYDSERQKAIARDFPNGFDAVSAGEVFGQHLAGLDNDHYLELSHRDRKRIFNLGYFTWVEQQGIALEDFDSRRDQSFWQGLAATLPDWDRMIEDFNGKTGVE